MDDPELVAQVGANVRRVRLEKGMTQDALAAASGLKKPNISRLETGRGPAPNVITVKRVAEALGVPICQLIDPAPEPKKRGK